jgi:maltooligosyltrehalose synthase
LGNQAVLTIAPRLVMGLTHGTERLPLGTEIWHDTAVFLPDAIAGTRLRNVLTQETFAATPGGRSLRLGEVLALFPVALLESVP